MSMNPITSPTDKYCDFCKKKPIQDAFIVSTIDRKIRFCSMKCIQCYRYLESKKIENKVTDLKESRK